MGEAAPEPTPEHTPDEAPESKSPHSRADWVVGAEDGVGAERRKQPREATELPRPKLVKPEDPNAGLPTPSGLHIRPHRGPSPLPSTLPGLDEAPSTPTWDRGRNSVPLPHIERGEVFARAPEPDPEHEFPMDDAEERAIVAAQVAEERALADAVASRPHEVVAPQEFDIPSIRPPWYMRLPEIIGSDRRVQLLLVLAVLALGAYVFWPRAEKTTSIGHLKDHPERYADQQVKVNGRVSEVFPVGGGFAYTLVQSRDTIVVFTRWHQPKRQDRVTVIGTVSSGFLDGQARLAIFEAAK
jgi:hypothetical protein